MIALVTGASGFIGSHLVKTLCHQGFQVRCLDIKKPRVLHKGDVNHCRIDITDLNHLESTGALESVDYIFHLAGATRLISLEAFRRANVLATQNLLDLIQKRKIPLKRFIFLSSQAAAGPAPGMDRPITENDPPEPLGFYAESKREAERVIETYEATIPFTILRPSAVYGPCDTDYLNIFKQVKSHLSLYPGYRDKYNSIIYVEDLVQGIIQAARSKTAEGKTYFLCAKNPVQWREVHRSVADVMGKRILELNFPEAVTKMVCAAGDAYAKLTGRYVLANSQKVKLSHPHYWICSADRAKQDFCFNPQTKLQDGLEKTYRWYIENHWL